MKILATIGPETIRKKNLKYLLKHTSLIRLNSSHNSVDWHKSAIKSIKKLKPKAMVLVDFPGIKPRTENLKNIIVKKNDVIAFSFKTKIKGKFIKLTKPLPKIYKKSSFSLDDGKILFKTKSIKDQVIFGRAINNCIIKPKKGLNIPGSIYDDKMQEKIYFKHFRIFKKSKIDAVGLSFVQNENIIIKLKKKYPNIIMVSKVENSEGLKNVDQISKFSDVIMIDRGDLSAEIGDENLYEAINTISLSAKKYGKPLIMATENLETFYKSNNPSRNDIVSLGFSKQINSDIIMLSEETALSPKWKKIFDWLRGFLKNKPKKLKKYNPDEIFWSLSKLINNYSLILFTKHGLMFDKIFKNNLTNQVIVFTDTKKTFDIARFYKNVTCILTPKFNNKNISQFYYKMIKKYKTKIFDHNDFAFLITISFPKKGARANSISLINKKNI
tara:strand:+ start:2740 stop:4065 length:1326 start_codon:yes stop_codon:yes gene_type:complete